MRYFGIVSIVFSYTLISALLVSIDDWLLSYTRSGRIRRDQRRNKRREQNDICVQSFVDINGPTIETNKCEPNVRFVSQKRFVKQKLILRLFCAKSVSILQLFLKVAICRMTFLRQNILYCLFLSCNFCIIQSNKRYEKTCFIYTLN